MKRIAVTGGSGSSGRYVARNLVEHGYEVVNLDRMPPRDDDAEVPFVEVDLTDYAALFSALQGCDAVVHMAGNPHPDYDFLTGSKRFENNTLTTYNVFNAAAAWGIERVIWASSETVLGFPYEEVRPDYLPMDEEHPLQPQSSYAISKALCEELARQMSGLYGITIIGLRFSNIYYTGSHPSANYDAVPSFWDDPQIRKFNLWSYVDARDAATSVRLALESDLTGSDNFHIGAADTLMNRPNDDLLEEVFPGLQARPGTGPYDSLLSSEKARRRLGYEPRHSWRDHVVVPAS